MSYRIQAVEWRTFQDGQSSAPPTASPRPLGGPGGRFRASLAALIPRLIHVEELLIGLLEPRSKFFVEMFEDTLLGLFGYGLLSRAAFRITMSSVIGTATGMPFFRAGLNLHCLTGFGAAKADAGPI